MLPSDFISCLRFSQHAWQLPHEFLGTRTRAEPGVRIRPAKGIDKLSGIDDISGIDGNRGAVDVHLRATTGQFPLLALPQFDGKLCRIFSRSQTWKEVKFLTRRAIGSFVLGTRQKVELKEESREPHEPEVEFDPVDDPVSLSILTQPPDRSKKINKTPNRYLGIHHALLMGNDMEDPETYTNAMLDIDSKKWQEAMKSEMDSMYANQVWPLVDAPEGIVPIGNKWVFKGKKSSDGKFPHT
ncbi:unnamed protein product [Prunus armeniaca]